MTKKSMKKRKEVLRNVPGCCSFVVVVVCNNPARSSTGPEQRRGLGLRLSSADDLLDRRDHAGQHDPTDVH